MTEPGTIVSRADLNDTRDLTDYLAMLDAYASDPMGAGRRIDAGVLQQLADQLPSLAGFHALLARRDGEAVGFATCLLAYSTFRARHLLNIHDIAVVSKWRGQGVAYAMLIEIERLAMSLDCCAVTLEVREDNVRAQALYRRFGFTRASCGLNMEKVI
ncbi:MAG: GNAT family N-acetyltransferase [Gammaproteobacteria bacterium]|nr:GNAT family N-acetyltransferase [Gammaproteobacteria bacterium]